MDAIGLAGGLSLVRMAPVLEVIGAPFLGDVERIMKACTDPSDPDCSWEIAWLRNWELESGFDADRIDEIRLNAGRVADAMVSRDMPNVDRRNRIVWGSDGVWSACDDYLHESGGYTRLERLGVRTTLLDIERTWQEEDRRGLAERHDDLAAAYAERVAAIRAKYSRRMDIVRLVAECAGWEQRQNETSAKAHEVSIDVELFGGLCLARMRPILEVTGTTLLPEIDRVVAACGNPTRPENHDDVLAMLNRRIRIGGSDQLPPDDNVEQLALAVAVFTGSDHASEDLRRERVVANAQDFWTNLDWYVAHLDDDFEHDPTSGRFDRNVIERVHQSDDLRALANASDPLREYGQRLTEVRSTYAGLQEMAGRVVQSAEWERIGRDSHRWVWPSIVPRTP